MAFVAIQSAEVRQLSISMPHLAENYSYCARAHHVSLPRVRRGSKSYQRQLESSQCERSSPHAGDSRLTSRIRLIITNGNHHVRRQQLTPCESRSCPPRPAKFC